MKRPKLLISIIVLVIIILSVVRVSIENSISTTGIEIVKLTEELEKQKKLNFQLEEKYLSASSLTHISSKAATLGYVNSGKTVNLSAPLPLAFNQ